MVGFSSRTDKIKPRAGQDQLDSMLTALAVIEFATYPDSAVAPHLPTNSIRVVAQLPDAAAA